MAQKTWKTSGWVMTILLALLFTWSAYLKLSQNETALAQAASIGFGAGTYQLIGVIELLALILFILPRTGVLGSLLLIAYMGGAIVTHLQHQQAVGMPLTVAVLVWVTAAIRFPELWQRLFPAMRRIIPAGPGSSHKSKL